MSLILIKQVRIGENPTTGIDIYDQTFFNSANTSIVTNQVEDGDLDNYEMTTGQLVFDTGGGTQYIYDGAGGVTSQPTPGTATYLLQLIRVDAMGDNVVDILGNYPPGAAVLVSSEPKTGFTFQNWTRFGIVVSTDISFNYIMPAANTILQANYQEDATAPEPDPPAPDNPADPEPLPTSFYDLELRVSGLQIPMPPFVQRQFGNMLTAELEGDYSYPVTIPLSPKQMIALGNPNSPQSKTQYFDPIPAEIWSHGNLAYRGFLDILKSDEQRIRASFILDSGFFISRNKELTIPECYGDEDQLSLANQPVYASGGFELRCNYVDVRLTVNSSQKLFLTAEYEDHIAIIEAMASWLGTLGLNLSIVIEYGEDLTDETTKIIYWDTDTITTCVLEVTTGTSRYTRAKKLTSRRLEMNDWHQVNEANRVAFPTIYNRNLYEGNNNLHDGIVNRYDEAGRLYLSNIRYRTYTESFRWEHCIIPFLYLTDVVKQIFKKIGITVTGEFFEEDMVQRMLLYNNRTLDFLQISLNGTPSRRTALAIHAGDDNPAQESYYYENVHDLEIKLANHAPEYSVIEFLKGLKNFFGLHYDFNILQNRVEIRFAKSKIRDRSVLDLTRQAGHVFTIDHGKDTGIAFTYENQDPLLADGSNPIPTPDFTVQNYLGLSGLDAEIYQSAFVESLRAYFQLTPDQDQPPFWKLHSFAQLDDGVDTSVESGEKLSWPLTLYPLVDSYFDGKKMPAIEVTTNQPEANLQNKDSGLRIMAFYGLQEDAAGRAYAFASVTRYDAQELLSQSQYNLDIRSEDMAPFHADQERILTGAKAYETELLLDAYTRLQLSKSPKIRIANLDYIIGDIEIQNTTKEFAIAKARLYKIQ